jgi:hypothetical protein
VFVYDEVVSDPSSRKLHLVGVFDSVRILPGATFPYPLKRMCVLAQFAGGLGRISFHVAVVDASTGNDIFGSPGYTISMPGGTTITTVLIRMRDCPFPHPGTYLVQLVSGTAFVDDRRITTT